MNFFERLFGGLLSLFKKPAPSTAPSAPLLLTAPSDLPPPSVRRISVVEELRTKLSAECHVLGYDLARKSKKRAPDQVALKALEALAEGKALGLSQSISGGAQDNLLRRLKEWETMLEQRVLDRDGAANKLNLARQALAGTLEPGAFPELAPLFRFMLTVWLAASLAPACHDLFVGLDAFMKWLAAGVVAGGISIAILHGILPSANASIGAPSKNNEARHRGALIAGILLGLGFFALRLSGARTYGDMILAGALAVIEISAIGVAERKTKPLISEIEGWRERTSLRRLAEAQVVTATQELDRRQDLVEAAEREIAQIEDGLERAHAVADAKLLSSIAVSAIKAGYMKGISETAAELGGAA